MKDACSPLFAAIDLGSNSFHMLIVKEEFGGLQTLAKIKQKVRLAKGLDAQCHLSNEAMERGWHCLRFFAERLQDIPQNQIRIVATAALRSAKNADLFIQKANQILGHPIELISGEKEASLIYQGAAFTTESEGNRLVIDIGGASTELIIGHKSTPLKLVSLPMGCVSWLSRFFVNNSLSAAHFNAAIKAAKDLIIPLIAPYKALGWQTCIGASGTVQALQEIMDAKGMGDKITLEFLYLLQAQCQAQKQIEQLEIEGLSQERAAVFPSGLAILIALFEQFDIQEMSLSMGALREGLLVELLKNKQQNQGVNENLAPQFEASQEAEIIRLQARFWVDTTQAKMVSQTALSLLKQCPDNWLIDKEAPMLLNAAARLYEMGLSVAFKNQAEHGAYLLKHQTLFGFSSQQKALLVYLVRHSQGPIALFNSPNTSLAKSAYRALCLLRFAIILCHRRQEEALLMPEIKCSNEGIKLSLSAAYSFDNPLLFQLLEQESLLQKNIHLSSS